MRENPVTAASDAVAETGVAGPIGRGRNDGGRLRLAAKATGVDREEIGRRAASDVVVPVVGATLAGHKVAEDAVRNASTWHRPALQFPPQR